MSSSPSTPNYVELGKRLLRGMTAVDRNAVQSQLQSIAVELMFGAEPAGLISRLIQLGAPPDEARRIIETGEKDPLVASGRECALTLRRRDWLLESLERLHSLSARGRFIERRTNLSGGEFLEFHYAQNRPVILEDEMATWPARAKWTPAYVHAAAGLLPGGGEHFPINGDEIIEIPLSSEILAPLAGDMGKLDKMLDGSMPPKDGSLRVAHVDALVPMHAEPRNQLLAQFSGRSSVKLAAPAEAARMYCRDGRYSDIPDFESEALDRVRFPLAASVRLYDVALEAGDILFVPMGWWHQVRTLDLGIAAVLVNFRWPNDFEERFPRALGPRAP